VTAWRSVITAVAIFEEFATLVAVIVTIWVVGPYLEQRKLRSSHRSPSLPEPG